MEEQRKQLNDANIIIHGVNQSENDSEKDYVNELLQDVNIMTQPTYVSRIGKSQGARPIKVIFTDAHEKYKFVKRLTELKNHQKYSKISITDDMTKMERNLVKEWKKKADERNQTESHNDYVWREAEERRREELMPMNFRTNAENDTKISMDYALQHHDALQGADRNIGQMRHTGMSALEQMKNQRMSLKGVRRRMMDIGNTLGLSNTVMRMIDKRGTQDKWIVYGGIILTLLIMFLTIKYLT
ncbi:uncharacterized protein [Clytia hemisphaerica]|uniref:uncharacterized protein n=1 Tax=Clytia hemisphaerica TaxID=252671 RepID=UPI0034D6943B